MPVRPPAQLRTRKAGPLSTASGSTSGAARATSDPLGLAGVDDMFGPEEKAVRAAVRQVRDTAVDP